MVVVDGAVFSFVVAVEVVVFVEGDDFVEAVVIVDIENTHYILEDISFI